MFLGGLGLGLGLGLFAVVFNGTAFYQELVAATATEGMRAAGYALDAGMLLSLALAIGGIACFTSAPSYAPTPHREAHAVPPKRHTDARRRKDRRLVKARASPAGHGST